MEYGTSEMVLSIAFEGRLFVCLFIVVVVVCKRSKVLSGESNH